MLTRILLAIGIQLFFQFLVIRQLRSLLWWSHLAIFCFLAWSYFFLILMIPRCLLNQTMSLAAETTLKNLWYLQDKRVFKKFSNSLKNELAKELLEKIPIYLHLFQHSGSSKANASYINRKSWREEWEECPDNFLFDEVAASKTSGEGGKSPTSFFSDKKLSVNSNFGDFATSTRQKNDSDSLKDAQWSQVSLAYFSQGRIFFSAEIWGR